MSDDDKMRERLRAYRKKIGYPAEYLDDEQVLAFAASERALERSELTVLYWFCSVCGGKEPAQEDYKHGDSEPCSDCAGTAVVLTRQEIEAMQWRCFHCGAVFVERRKAIEHFGVPGSVVQTACRVDAAHLRALEKELAGYRNEDTDLHQQMHRMAADHAVALRREEEKGYARGLSDARAEMLARASEEAAPEFARAEQSLRDHADDVGYDLAIHPANIRALLGELDRRARRIFVLEDTVRKLGGSP